MPDARSIIDGQTFDAIVVGSGPNGSIAAMTLSEAGLRVLVLEAGPAHDPRQVYSQRLKQLVRGATRASLSRRQHVQSLQPLYWGINPDLFIDDRDNPYSTPDDAPFTWIRSRQVGGRSLTWGGRTIRLSDYEFKAASHDGFGEDWPISHDDLAPHYARIERLFEVCGKADGLPQAPDGAFVNAEPLTPGEMHVANCIQAKWPERPVITARGIGASPDHHYSEDAPWPALSTITTSLKRAIKTGRTTLHSDAAVCRILFDEHGHVARGVTYVDKISGSTREAKAELIVLCASTIETVRLLLQSSRPHDGSGFADQSGTLGHFLMDHVSTSRSIYFPDLPPSDDDYPMLGSSGFVVPRFQNLFGKNDKPYLRGFGTAAGLQRGGRLPAFMHRRVGGSHGFIAAHGEMLPRFENCITLNDTVRDRDGRPVAHITCRWSDNEQAMADDMDREISAMMSCAGGEDCNLSDLLHLGPMARSVDRMQARMRYAVPGFFVHEVGGARMGRSPQTSVVNDINQVWSVPNLLVTDGACWVTSGWQNPTLTQMAITMRACRVAAGAKANTTEH